MKKILFSLMLSLVSYSFAIAQDIDMFFSLIQGEKFYYTCYDAQGEVEAYYSFVNNKIEGDLSNGKVNYDYVFLKKDRTPLFSDEGHMKMDITLNSEGTTSHMYDIGKATAIQDLVTLGDVTTLPQVLVVGESLPAGVIKVKIKAVNATFTISQREILSLESITTPAGTFDAYKLKEKQTTKVLLSSKDYFFTTWYVRNIGAVKQMIYDKKGNLVRSIELTKIEN